MSAIITLTGSDLESFYQSLGIEEVPAEVYRLRVMVDGDCVKVKANEWTWSPPIGGPESD
jgi:hypothetical protein